MNTWRESQFLTVPLTREEIQARGEQLAKLLGEADALALAHKSERERMKEETARLDGQVQFLATVVRDRVEERSVDVELRLNVALGLVEEARLDTGEIFRTRPATEEDRLRMQLRLPGTETKETQ